MAKSNPFLSGGLVSSLSSVSWAPFGTTAPGQFSTAPTPPVGQFSGLPFDLAVGEIYGLRVWRVDTYGRLRARHVTTAKPWRPGVNVAECNAERSVDITHYYQGRRIVSGTSKYRGNGSTEYLFTLDDGSQVSTTDMPESRYEPRPPHEVPDESCKCGFYAYTELDHNELDYNPAERMVIGVVKGTGRTLLGSQGFRSEKAEIVALVSPAGTGEGTKNSAARRLADQIARAYPDIPMLATRRELLEFAPVESQLPDPSTDEFWTLP